MWGLGAAEGRPFSLGLDDWERENMKISLRVNGKPQQDGLMYTWK
jgi:hypothetical protein